MKNFLASALMLLAPAFALAQTVAQPAAKPAPKATAKAPAKATAAKATKTAKAEPPSSRTQLRSATGQVAAGIMAAEAALSPAELAIAERVHVGRIACELGAHVSLKADPAAPGHFDVEGKGFKYRMTPVATTTGTVRLEDPKGGAVWLQIANKSMLMDQKRGQRLADECMSPEQFLVAESLKKNPPPSVLEPLPVAKN
ncbi:MAG TPA: hypothetical protein PKM82_13695 [Acidovorax sp.]|nr:hypothetical protein [Acidovorax sp.]